MAVRDRACRLRLEPTADRYCATMTVDDVDYEILPPPAFLAGRIARIFRVLAEMDIKQPRAEQSAPLHLAIGEGRAELMVTMGPNEYGYFVNAEFRSNTITSADVEAVMHAYGLDGEDAAITFTEDDA